MSELRGRFQFDLTPDGRDEILDEIVLTHVTVHIERMSHHGWWMAFSDDETGERVDLRWLAATEVMVDDYGPRRPFAESAEWTVREPLLYACHHRWADRREAEHQCEVESRDHRRCRCECGATKSTPPDTTTAALAAITARLTGQGEA